MDKSFVVDASGKPEPCKVFRHHTNQCSHFLSAVKSLLTRAQLRESSLVYWM
jgi:hypothetical protein